MGNGCTLRPQEIQGFMRLLTTTSSPSDEFHLTLTNMTVTGFQGVTVRGGVFHISDVTFAQVLHITCVKNSAYKGGCMAFTGGSNIAIENCK